MADWTEARVVALLDARYPAPEWAFVAGLRTQVGYAMRGRESYLDAFAMRCYPSKGLTRCAFEVKVSRSDWLSELRDAGKRANGMAASNEFWYVAPPGVIKKGEVPEGCGWMVAHPSVLRVQRAAPHREVEPLSEEFTASLLRMMTNPERLHPAQARAFRYAGQDLTPQEFLDATAKDVEQQVVYRARGMARDLLQEAPEYALGLAARKAMGVAWRVPTPEDFSLWLASVQMPAQGMDPKQAESIRRRLAYLSRELEELSQAVAAPKPAPAARSA